MPRRSLDENLTFNDQTKGISGILCMHLAACRFFKHLTALMHLQNSIK